MHAPLIAYDGPAEFAGNWQGFCRDYMAGGNAERRQKHLELLNELAFKLPSEPDKLKLYASLGDFIARHNYGNVEHLHNDLSRVIHANADGDVDNPLNRSIIDGLVKGWDAIRTANHAPKLPEHSHLRSTPQWREYEAMQASPEGGLIASALFAATDASIKIQTHAAMRKFSGVATDFDSLYATACNTWQQVLFRTDPQVGHFLNYLSMRIKGRLHNIVTMHKPNVSLDEQFGDEAGRSFYDVKEDAGAVDPSQAQDKQDNVALLELAIQTCLTPREAKVLRAHFGMNAEGEGRTQEDISQEMNLSKGRIGQIEGDAMQKIRRFMEAPNRAVKRPPLPQVQPALEPQVKRAPMPQDKPEEKSAVLAKPRRQSTPPELRLTFLPPEKEKSPVRRLVRGNGVLVWSGIRAHYLEALRIHAKLTQEQAAQRMGVPLEVIADSEIGKAFNADCGLGLAEFIDRASETYHMSASQKETLAELYQSVEGPPAEFALVESTGLGKAARTTKGQAKQVSDREI